MNQTSSVDATDNIGYKKVIPKILGKPKTAPVKKCSNNIDCSKFLTKEEYEKDKKSFSCKVDDKFLENKLEKFDKCMKESEKKTQDVLLMHHEKLKTKLNDFSDKCCQGWTGPQGKEGVVPIEGEPSVGDILKYDGNGEWIPLGSVNLYIGGNTLENCSNPKARYNIGLGYKAGIGQDNPVDSTDGAIAIGYQSGGKEEKCYQQDGSIAIGVLSAHKGQGKNATAIGPYTASESPQGDKSVALGFKSGRIEQGCHALAAGTFSGEVKQGISAVSLGDSAGKEEQSAYSVSIGFKSGCEKQQECSVAIGSKSGEMEQGKLSVAVGNEAGCQEQAHDCVSIGNKSGHFNQGTGSVSIGSCAGLDKQGCYSVALGYQAATNSQSDNSIVINATGKPLDGKKPGLFAAPIRKINKEDPLDNIHPLYYDTDSCEILFVC